MEAGALAYSGPKEARPVLEALMYEPAVNLNGLCSGSLTGKTIVPHEARAALDVRADPRYGDRAPRRGYREERRTGGPCSGGLRGGELPSVAHRPLGSRLSRAP